MQLNEMVAMQREFDERRSTTFDWSRPYSSQDFGALVHNVLALAGEVGELANLVKKLDRGDLSFDALMSNAPGELADIFIYTLKIAYQGNIDLETAFLAKLSFNAQRFTASDPGFTVATTTDFPASDLARNGDLALIREVLHSTALRLLQSWGMGIPNEIVQIFLEVGVPVPANNQYCALLCLASLIWAHAGSFIGQPERRKKLLDILIDAVDPDELGGRELSLLTTRDSDLAAALAPAVATR
ncbi:hypothetical protein [Aestuariimicrobium sp. Y1814]|uniref:hypothetical protein n=1 Tax=Aestuariimicrobium sp. Y1814 TaxID=3418742 RepID=UPI003DA733F8